MRLFFRIPKYSFYRKILVVLILSIHGIPVFLFSQSGHYTFNHLEDKFPELDAYVDQATCDPQGFIWFGGEILILRYDGYSIKTYPIRSMLEKIKTGQNTYYMTSQIILVSNFKSPVWQYIFYVIGNNYDYNWKNERIGCIISVLNSWFATVFVFVIYIITGIGLFIWWRRYKMRRLQLEHKAKLERAEADKLREIDKTKSEFFSNISHEFRTPLTLIISPLEEIIRKTDDITLKKSAIMMKRNAHRLLKMINQILDLSMLDAGSLKIQASCHDLGVFIRDIVANFESAAVNKQIELTCHVPQSQLMVYFDSDKLEDVLDNLLDNALKFTSTGGKVIVDLQMKEYCFASEDVATNVVEIIIRDSGKGIPTEKVSRIFDRFYQVDTSQSRKHEGAGIGLSLVSELVKLHRGTISVHSEEGKGTTFTIRLKLGILHFQPDEINSGREKEELTTDVASVRGKYMWPPEALDIKAQKLKSFYRTDLPLILVVENHTDMRHYIVNNLDHQFTFLEASDGYIGFEMATKTIPDLILSDLMMPCMDGYELCLKIRADERTRHIPIIILTAKAAKKNQIQGYECGADDYVIKPFDQEMLLARIKNLLRERKMLAEKFSKAWATNLSVDRVPNADEKFITRLNFILEKKYSDPEFGTTALGKEAGYSHSALYRKLKSLTNLPPNTYIRNFRLIKANEMLCNQHIDVSTAAYSCGFNNLSYFSKCYRYFFNQAPHEKATPS